MLLLVVVVVAEGAKDSATVARKQEPQAPVYPQVVVYGSERHGEQEWLTSAKERLQKNENKTPRDQEEGAQEIQEKKPVKYHPETNRHLEVNTTEEQNTHDQDTAETDYWFSSEPWEVMNQQHREAQERAAGVITVALVEAVKETGRQLFGIIDNNNLNISIATIFSWMFNILLMALFFRIFITLLTGKNLSDWGKYMRSIYSP